MKKINLKILLAIFIVMGIAFIGCSDDDDGYNNGPDDTTIAIDSEQAFNMKNFAASFEQLFASNDRWQLSFTHDYVNGKALESYMNYKIYGEFGNKAATIVHYYDSKGVIISSERNGVANEDDDLVVFTYKYDLQGYIVQLTKKENGNTRDIVNLEYNNLFQLIKKSHINGGSKPAKKGAAITARGDFDEFFTYDTNGNVIKYTKSYYDPDEYYGYLYQNGNMIQKRWVGDGSADQVTNYEYDSSNRITKELPEGSSNWRNEYLYSTDLLSVYHYDDSRLESRKDYIEGLLQVKYWSYRYDYSNNNAFEYCSTKEFFYEEGYKDGLVSKKEYFEGTPQNLVLVGYVVVDTRDAANEYKKTKESIYDANDTLLYYVEYEVSNGDITSHQTYLPNGTAIPDYDIDDSYMWIEELISDINIT